MLAFFPLKLSLFVNILYNLFLNIVLAIFIFSSFTLYSQCIRHVCSTGNRSCDMLNWNIYSACKQLLSCAQSFPSPHRWQTIRKSRLQFVLLLHFRCGTSFSALSVCNQLLLSLLLLLCTSLTFSFLQWQIEKAIQTNPIAKPPEKERERGRGLRWRRGKFRFMRRSKLISSTNLRRLPLSWQRCRRWQQLLICNASDAATTSPLPPPSTFLPLSIPVSSMSLLNAWRIIFTFDFVSFFSSSRRVVILLSSLLCSPLFLFSAALFSLASSSGPSSNSSSWHFRLLPCQMRKSGN